MTLTKKRRKGLVAGMGVIAMVTLVTALWVAFQPPNAADVPGTGPAALAQAAAAMRIAQPGEAASTASLDGIALASPNAAAVTVASAANAWGGPRSGNEATLSDRVVHYDIEAELDPVKHTLDGKEKLTWRNRSSVPVRSVYLHLYLNAFEGSGSTFYSERQTRNFTFRTDVPVKDGEWGHTQLTRVQQGGVAVPWLFVHPDNGPQTDHTVVRLDLPQAVPPGQSTVLNIDFKAQLPRVVARTGYFGSFHLVGQWYPKIAVLELPGERGATTPRWNAHEFHLHSEFYADFANFDVKLTVPSGYTVGATGEAQGPPVTRGNKVTHHYVQGDVHDFAWTADNRTATPLEGIYTGAGSPQVKVTVLFAPEHQSNAQPVLKATLDALAYFSRTLGPYPYRTVTVVIPPFNAGEAGGMEYPTFFTTSSHLKLKPDSLDSYLLDFVTIHEFGHGYFYGILASNEFEEPMLDEGLNEYWDSRMMQERGQLLQPLPSALRNLGMRLGLSHFELSRRGAGLPEPADALGHNAWDRLSSGGYGSVYARTATTLHDLEGRLGRRVMEQAFKTYYDKWKFRHPSIADFRDVLIEVSGQRQVIETVFAQQVYATRRVDDRIEKFTSEEVLPLPGTVEVNGVWVEDTQKMIDQRVGKVRKAWAKSHPDRKDGLGPFPYRTTLTLRRRGAGLSQTAIVKFADGSSEVVRWDSSNNWERYSWVKPAKAVSVSLDPLSEHWLDASKLDDSRTVKAERSASQRWGSQFAALTQVIFSLIATL